jgi:hypothetical protein
MVQLSLRDAFLSGLYKNPKTPEEIIDSIETILQVKPIEIKTCIWVSDSDLFKLLLSKTINHFSIKSLYETEKVLSAELSHHSDNITLKGKFLILKSPLNNIYILITHESSAFFNGCLKRYLRRLYPRVYTTFLNSKKIATLIEGFHRTHSYLKIRSREISFKKKIKSKGARKKEESAKIWTDEEFKETLNRAKIGNEWITRIKMDILTDHNKIHLAQDNQASPINKKITFYLDRTGTIKVRTAFKLFYDSFVTEIINYASERAKFFKNRGRRDTPNYEARPIIIEYGYDIFKDKNQNAMLVAAIKKMPYVSQSVIHANPYLHSSIIDYLDGSSYDIWVLSNNRITIVPQLRATYASLNRLTENISEHFEEGLIKDIKEVSANNE